MALEMRGGDALRTRSDSRSRALATTCSGAPQCHASLEAASIHGQLAVQGRGIESEARAIGALGPMGRVPRGASQRISPSTDRLLVSYCFHASPTLMHLLHKVMVILHLLHTFWGNIPRNK